MKKETFLNDFAIRSFRDVGDYDYICARMAFRSNLLPQFLWSGLQAIEKYFKCILLINRIKFKKVGHDLLAALKLIEDFAPFNIRIRKPCLDVISHLNKFGRFRYLEVPFYLLGLELPKLDMAVWDIRRYCTVLDYSIKLPDGTQKSMFEHELKNIEASEKNPPQLFKILGGELEKIIGNKQHPARKNLIWQNLFFGPRPKYKIQIDRYFHATNSPLSLHPEMIDYVLEYVYLPAPVISAYKKELEKQRTIQENLTLKK